MARKKGLTARQRQLFNTMVREGGTVSETAVRLRIRETTLRRWNNNPDFTAEWDNVNKLLERIAKTDAIQHRRAAGTAPDEPATTPVAPPATDPTPPPPHPAPERAPRQTRPDRDPADDESDTPPLTEREWLLQTKGPEIAAQFDAIFGPPTPTAADPARHPGEVTP